ncbi:MAG: hypothetical protein WC843_00935 [Candidatus Gracilibacteria bacterium]|jgi:hypothetical protein
MKHRIFTVREIAYKKDSKFLAVSLDLDLMAEGKTMGQAIDRLREATIGYLSMCCKDNESDKEIYRKAPKKYFDLYELFKELNEKSTSKTIENFVGKATYNPSISPTHA